MNPSKMPALAVREGQWELLCDFDGASPELYNLEDDPGEVTNLVDTHSEISEKLTNEVLRWSDSMQLDSPDAIKSK